MFRLARRLVASLTRVPRPAPRPGRPRPSLETLEARTVPSTAGIDPTFGVEGIVAGPPGLNAQAVALQADGKIVAAGAATRPQSVP